MKKFIFSSILVAALASSSLNANEIEQEGRALPLVVTIGYAAGVTSLSYLNAPTLTSPIYSSRPWSIKKIFQYYSK